ncbi:putative cyclase [mine drainage metagenome]|uniref:Putative cyclase n=1 Tax=mine drainage metagenome TaxID=410659 RepID=T1BBG5_9ZZZZ
MRRVDISMPLYPGMAAFPGDPEFRSVPSHSIARGDAYNVSALAFGSHAGTHLDPPRHFLPDGATTDALDLAAFNGPCEVVDVDPTRAEVGPDDVRRAAPDAERVLFRTANSARWAASGAFFNDYVGLTPAAADAAVARRFRLVGIDALSVERDPTGTFPVHHRLLGRGTLILEGLRLAEAPPGRYELVCLPLRIEGGDGGPSRAVLLAP